MNSALHQMPRMKSFGFLLLITLAAVPVGCTRRQSGPSAEHSAAEDGVTPVQLTDDNFQREVLDSEQPVLVDLGAQWCQPCISLKPTLRKLAAEFAGEVRIGELDVDANAFVTEKYDVEQYPTLIVFRDGQEVERLVGLKTHAELAELLRSLAASSDPLR